MENTSSIISVSKRDSSSRSSDEEEEDAVQPVVYLPPSQFSNNTFSGATTDAHVGHKFHFHGNVIFVYSEGSKLDMVQLKDALEKARSDSAGHNTGGESEKLSKVLSGMANKFGKGKDLFFN